MLIDTTTHPYFVPDGNSRKDAAILLVGTAEEAGLDPNSVVAVRGGFRVNQEVSDLLGGLEPYVDPLEVAVAAALAAEAESGAGTEAALAAESGAGAEPDDGEPDDGEPDDGEPDDGEPGDSEGDLFDPADYTVEQVKGFIGEHPELAADVLNSEAAGKNRTSLVEWLQNTTTSG